MANGIGLKIFDVPWHVAHQYHLFSVFPEHKFYLLRNNVRKWNKWSRPIPDNVEFVDYYEPGKYDLAILHVDQQCINPDIGKGKLYRGLNDIITDIPKVVINHGTPVYPEMWNDSRGWRLPYNLKKKSDITKFQNDFVINGGTTTRVGKLVKVEGMKKLIGDNFMVVNSYESQKQWGWGEVIIHGIDSSEWWDLPKEPRAITMISPAGLDYYYNRQLLKEVKELLTEKGFKHYWITVDWQIEQHPTLEGWDAYRDFVGRSLIYFNPTKESPMPRSRTEAMLSGCCVLTTKGQDAERFIKDGQNGFIVPENPLFIAKLIQNLIEENYELAIKLGQEGKKTAIKEFGVDRYKKQWQEVFNKLIK